MVAFGAGFVWAAGVASFKNLPSPQQKEHQMAELTEEAVLAGVREELAQLKVPGAAEATMETEWRDLDIDSLELVELVTALEDRFDVKIADGELKSIAGVGDAVRLTLSLANEPRLGVSVAVTGRGVVTSLGEGADAFFDSLAAGASGIVDGLSRALGLRPRALHGSARRAAHRPLRAVRDRRGRPGRRRGGPRRLRPRSRRGRSSAPGVGGLITLQENCESFLERGERGVSPNFVPMMMPNAAAGAVAIRLGIHGPGLQRRLGVRHRRARDRRGHADDRARRRRRRRRRRHRGRADLAVHRRVPAHGRALERRASRGPSTPAATAS